MLKRIETRKEKRKKFWMGFVLASLMILSMLGIIVGRDSGEDWEYNGFKFSRVENVFITKINGRNIGFNFLPQSLLDINVSADIIKATSMPMMYTTFNPENSVQDLIYIDSVRQDLPNSINTLIVDAITKESNVYLLPIITCDNATSYTPVFYFNISNTTSIIEKNNCIVLNAKNVEFFKLRDLILYNYYGIINE